LLRYSDLTVIKMAAVRHIRFLGIQFLTADVGRVNVYIIVPNFAPIGQAVADRDMAVFRFFKMAVRQVGFVIRLFRPPTKSIWWSLSLGCFGVKMGKSKTFLVLSL